MDLIVLAHPNADSFNHAIASRISLTLDQLKRPFVTHDLYADQFPPALPAAEIERGAELPEVIQRHCEQLVAAECIYIVHPNWWGMPPAVMKGWIDRVFRPGVAYRFSEGDSGEGVPCGLLHARDAVIFNTSNTSAQREQCIFGDPLDRIWRECVFGLCGVERVHRRMFETVVTSTTNQRDCWLNEVEQLVCEVSAGTIEPRTVIG